MSYEIVGSSPIMTHRADWDAGSRNKYGMTGFVWGLDPRVEHENDMLVRDCEKFVGNDVYAFFDFLSFFFLSFLEELSSSSKNSSTFSAAFFMPFVAPSAPRAIPQREFSKP